MIWLTWRQSRTQAVTGAAAVAAFAVLFAVTAPHVASLYTSSGVADCRASACAQDANNFDGLLAGGDTIVFVLGLAGIVLAPILIGIFWGAPLIAREFETGTFRMAWTQSVTRSQWLASKLVLPALAAMAMTEGLSLLYGWWAAPIAQAARLATQSHFPLGMSPFGLLAFDTHGVTPLGYAAFAFALGVTTGIFIRRAIPAMAITLAVFAAVQVAMPLVVRPNLITPDRTTVAIGSVMGATHIATRGSTVTVGETVMYLPSEPGSWIISSQIVNAAGQPVRTMPASCLNPGSAPPGGGSEDLPDPRGCTSIQASLVAVTYQPASRYWPLQEIETAIYLALALALGGFSYWRLRARVM
jgi:ABC-2 family transporter protein